MRNHRTVVAGLVVGLLFAGAAQGADGTAPVTRVIVFADRAEITRSLTAGCRGGKAEASFPGLPAGLDERTLRADVALPARVLGTASRLAPAAAERDTRLESLQAAQRQVIAELQALRDQDAVYQNRLAAIASFSDYTQALLVEEMRGQKPDPRQWERGLDQFKAERLAVSRKLGDDQIKRRELERRRELNAYLLGRQAAPEQGGPQAEVRTVTVALDCGGAERPLVSLSYVIPGATWRPEYDLRFVPDGKTKGGKGTVELTVSAIVSQATGEDWREVELVLSTAAPRLGAESPRPAPLFINGYKVGKQKVVVTSLEDREGLAGPAGQPATAEPVSGAVLADQGLVVQFTLPRKVTVRSDGRPYWMPIDVVAGAGEARLLTIPRLAPYVYQVVALKNPAAYPLLPGTIHSYRAGSYMGDSPLAYKAPGEPMEVSLGFDDEVKVERKDLLEKDRTPGFWSRTKHLERAFLLKLTNRSAEPVGVEVREGIPVSKTEEIRVELRKDKTTAGYTQDGSRGILSWTVSLERGQEKALDLAYTVHLPDSWEIQGQ